MNEDVVAEFLQMAVPEEVANAMLSEPAVTRSRNTYRFRLLDRRERFVVDTMSAPMMDLACAAAIRVVRKPLADIPKGKSEVVRDYMKRLLRARRRYVRRVWRILSPLAA